MLIYQVNQVGTEIGDIKEELWNKVDAIIDGGTTDIGLESTVVKVIDGIPTILRPGKVTKEDIEKVIGVAAIDPKLLRKITENEKVESPGMKYKHYAPNKKCVLVTGNDNEQINKINKLSKIKKIGVVGFSEHKEKIKVDNYLEIGKKNNLDEISRNMFRILRKVDYIDKVELIAIEAVEEKGLGLAILNRLIRACEYNVI